MGGVKMQDIPLALWAFITSVFGAAPYLKPWVVVAWYVSFAVIAVLTAITVHAVYFSPNRFDVRFRERVRLEAETLVQSKGWSLQYNNGREALLEKKQDMPASFPGAVYEKRLLIDGETVRLRTIVIHESGAWKLNEFGPDSFERIAGGSLDVAGLLKSEPYVSLIGDAKHVVGVGLASTSANETVSGNETLSVNRARQLCSLLREVVSPSAQKLWLLALGSALDSPTNTEASRRQRSIIVIGISSGPDFDAQRSLKAVLLQTSLSEVKLDRYSRSKDPIFENCP